MCEMWNVLSFPCRHGRHPVTGGKKGALFAAMPGLWDSGRLGGAAKNVGKVGQCGIGHLPDPAEAAWDWVS